MSDQTKDFDYIIITYIPESGATNVIACHCRILFLYGLYTLRYISAVRKLNTTLYWTIIASEFGHIFCCVLPTVFSILSLMSGLGMISVMPMWLQSVHALIHAWEIPMIITSGVLLALGWGLYAYSKKIDCHDTGCEHEPCTPKKNMSHTLLKIATILFLINVTVFFVFHRGLDIASTPQYSQYESSDAHHHHDH